jgi:hypothetical protein
MLHGMHDLLQAKAIKVIKTGTYMCVVLLIHASLYMHLQVRKCIYFHAHAYRMT